MNTISIRNIHKSFDGKEVLSNFNAEIPTGSVTALMGLSGCGKTTLLNILMGFEKPDSGEVCGIPERISAVFQEDRLCESFSALTNLRLVYGKNTTDDEALQLLGKMGLKGSEKKPVRELSGGMRRRVAIARALLAEGDMLILDEPFKGLDESTREEVAGEILSQTQGKTVLMVTHDRREAEMLHGTVLEMEPIQCSCSEAESRLPEIKGQGT